MVPFCEVYNDSGGESLAEDFRSMPTDSKGIGMSLTSDCQSSVDSEVTDPSSPENDSSESVEDSDADDVWYSCLSGEDERRRTCFTGDKMGAAMLFKLIEL